MSEQFPETEAYQPDYLHIDGRERLLSADAQLYIEDVNRDLIEASIAEYEDILEDANADFARYLPANDSVAFADCFAEAYEVAHDGEVAEEPQLYMLDDMQYHGLDVHTFSGKEHPELVLQFQEKLSYERSAPLRYYYVKPVEKDIHAFDLEVFEELRGEEVRDILQKSSAALLEMVLSQSFADATPDVKQSMMSEFYAAVEYSLAEAAPEASAGIEIDATTCYGVPYGEPIDARTLANFEIPHLNEVIECKGDMMRVVVPEFNNIPASEWTTPSMRCDLYVVLDNSDDEAEYLVPVQALEAVAFLRDDTFDGETDTL